MSAQTTVRAAAEARQAGRKGAVPLSEASSELRAGLAGLREGPGCAGRVQGAGRAGRGGAACVLASAGKGETGVLLAGALVEHLAKGGGEQRVLDLLAALEREHAMRDIEAERREAERLAALRARLEALLRRLPGAGADADPAAKAALDGVRAISSVSAQLALARVGDQDDEAAEALAHALEQV